MKLNSIYTTFNGEVNPQGIGSPCIFVRLQGCHLRCYLKTMGILCDTPEGLERSKERDNPSYIFSEIEKVAEKSGLKLITLTGGDPLWNKKGDLILLLSLLSENGYTVNVETSGTISWLPYQHLKNINWILDYKCSSTGVDKKLNLLDYPEHLSSLVETDYIKFVVKDQQDYSEFLQFLPLYDLQNCKAKIAVGPFWGGELNPIEIFKMLERDGLLAKTIINMQTHKMAVSSDYSKTIPTDI